MPQMNGTGPEKKGPQTGRKLGACSDYREKDSSLFGKGIGKRRNSGGGMGMGKRFQYDTKIKKT
jgi:hypothetical protein